MSIIEVELYSWLRLTRQCIQKAANIRVNWQGILQGRSRIFIRGVLFVQMCAKRTQKILYHAHLRAYSPVGRVHERRERRECITQCMGYVLTYQRFGNLEHPAFKFSQLMWPKVSVSRLGTGQNSNAGCSKNSRIFGTWGRNPYSLSPLFSHALLPVVRASYNNYRSVDLKSLPRWLKAPLSTTLLASILHREGFCWSKISARASQTST